MRRSVKKGIAFFMALSMVAGFYQPVDAKASEKDQLNLTMLTEETYDEAAILSDKVVLLENGNFAGSGSQYEYVEEDQYSNVSTDTNIVFVDAKGNKTVVSNKTSNGDTLFDAVYPMISDWYVYDMVKVVKDHKISYIKGDGTYFGGSLQYFKYAQPLSNELLLVSDDGEIYTLLNENGQAVQKNLTDCNGYYRKRGKYYYLYGEESCLVIDKAGKTVKHFKDYLSFYGTGSDCMTVAYEDRTEVYDVDLNLIFRSEEPVNWVNTDYLDQGYIVLDYLSYSEEAGFVYSSKIVNVKTMQCELELINTSVLEDGIIIGEKTMGITSVFGMDGTEYISNLDEYILSVAGLDSENSWSKWDYRNGKLYASIREEDGEIRKTMIFSKENNFGKNTAKIFDGFLGEFSYDEQYFITEGKEGTLKALLKEDGTVVKSFEESDVYRYPWNLYKYYFYGDEYESATFDGILFQLEVYSGDDYVGQTYMTNKGEIGKTYDYIFASGNFLIGEYGEGTKMDVIDESGKVVYTGTEVIAGGFWWKDYFYVEGEGRCLIYDAEGNVIFGNSKEYAGIGYTGTFRNAYFAHEEDLLSGYYYENTLMENGLCVTAINTDEGAKYGVAILKDKKATYTGLQKDGSEWFMYENGEVTGKYNGLVKYNGQWWYVKNSKVDFGYTGLCKKDGSWFYVKNGAVDFTYKGLCKKDGSWFYVKGGVVDFKYTGLCKYNGSWFYVKGGVADFKYTGLCKYNGSWFYVKGGVVDFKYTGLCKYNGSWYYVKGGVLDFKYTGLCKYNGSWFYVKGGVVDFKYTGLCKYNGSWYYVKGGVLDFKYTGLCKYNGSWYYIKGGVLNWKYTGLCKYGSSWYYVQNGVLNWKYTGYTNYGGARWYVKNGVMVKKA